MSADLKRVIFTEAATADLERIYDYILENTANTEIAWRTVGDIEDHCSKLRQFPLRGRARDDLFPGARILPFRDQAVVIYLADDAVLILRVLYAGEDVTAALLSGKP